MGYVSLSTACTSKAVTTEGIEATAIKDENVALLAPGLSSLGKAEKTSWLPTSWQEEANS